MPPASGLLVAASRQGRPATVQKLLDEGVPINKPGPKGVTALRAAAESGHAFNAQLLLRSGAEIDVAAFEALVGTFCGGLKAAGEMMKVSQTPATLAGSGRSGLNPQMFEPIDLAPFVQPEDYDDEARQRSARAWDHSFCNVGFAIVKAHGVAQDLIQDMRRAAKAFFDSTSDKKGRFYRGPQTGRSGYSPYTGKEQGGHGDPLEGYMFMRSNTHGWRNLDDKHPEELDGIGQRYCDEMEKVMHALHRISAVALGQDVNYFDSFYEPPASVLVISHYPALRPPLRVQDGKLRYRAHSDYSGFTVLCQDEGDWDGKGTAGLEIDVNGVWVPVKPSEGNFVVNIGDLFETWTNDRWRSTPHRVSSPKLRSAAASKPRLTMMLFSGPSLESMIEPINTCVTPENPRRYAGVKASEHLRGMWKTKSKEAKYKPG